MSLSPDGTILASASAWDDTIRLWDASTLTPIATLKGHTSNVDCVSFSPDGKTLASGARDRTIKLWDASTLTLIATRRKTTTYSVTFSPDGRILASGEWDGAIRLWDASTLTLIATLKGHTSKVNSVSFSPDGSTLASGSNDGTILLWDLSESTLPSPELVDEISPDPNLHAAIRTALGKASGDPISPAEMATLPHLEASEAEIRSLTGLELATNLTSLNLWDNRVSNISVVSGLTNLTWLTLGDNSISDISPLAGLANLTYLNLDINTISDISALTGLTNLEELFFSNNSISDISALAGLTNLNNLSFIYNSISDISPLAGLANLTYLNFYGNSISDISPLVANTGLGDEDTVDVGGNPLSYQSIHTHIPILQSRGVTVEFDNKAYPALLKISGDNQKGGTGADLPHPFVVEAQDGNGAPLAGVVVTFTVTTGDGMLNTTLTRTDENGRARSTLTLGPNLGTNTVKVSAAGIEAPATFHAVSDTEAPPITADVNRDENVNILDLVVIASSLGQSGQNNADVNGDGVVSILDLILVAGMFDEVTAAPSVHPQVPESLTAVEVQGWLTDARSLEVRDTIMKRGFAVLEQLLVFLTPRETELLSNYPNPFNPETWIPYRLAEDAFVTLTIYDQTGQVVRTLDVGHRIASAYENQSKAVYWDGRNDLGEQVASGVYFYHLSAGEYSATRRLVILK